MDGSKRGGEENFGGGAVKGGRNGKSPARDVSKTYE